MKKEFTVIVCMALLGFSCGVVAQEQSAGGEFSTESKWMVLHKQVDEIHNTNKILRIQVDQQLKCNLEGSFWLPENPKSDNNGCLRFTLDKKGS